jgi:hypothetical protein
MAKDNRIQFAIMCFIFGGGLVSSGVRRWRRTRKVQDTPTAPISTAPQGLAEFQGHAWPLANGFTPTLRGEPAVFYHLILQKYVKKGKNSEWRTVYDEVHNAPFLIVDKTAIAMVNPAGGEVDSLCETRAWKRLRLPEQQDLQRRVAGRLRDFSPGWFQKYRVIETAVLMGSPLYATGNFSTPNGNTEVVAYPGLNEFSQFSKLSTTDAGLRRLDLNKDGTVCEVEAITGMHSTAKNVAALARKTSPQGTRFTIAGILAADATHKLFLADCHQHHLVDRVGTGNLARILAGALLIGAGVGILFLPKPI